MSRPAKWTPFEKLFFDIAVIVNFVFFAMSGIALLAYTAAYYADVLPADELTDYPGLILVFAFTAWVGFMTAIARENQDRYYPEN